MSPATSELITIEPPRAIVTVDQSTVRADSRQVAVTFGKRHADVLRAIDALVANEPRLRERNFAFTSAPTALPHGGVREDRYCLMDRDGFSFLAMGFTGARAMRWKIDFIEAFKAMEAELQARPAAPVTPSGMMAALQDPATVLALIAHHAQQTIAARAEAVEAKAEAVVTRQALVETQAVVNHAKPKVEAYDHLMSDEGTCCLADAARIIGAPQARFFDWLRKRGIVFDKGEDTLPDAKYRKEGYFRVRLVRVHRNRYREQTMVTRSGLDWLRLRWSVGPAKEIEAEAQAARRQGVLGL